MSGKELRDLFYFYNRETLSESEYKSEVQRLKNICGAYPKPLRTDKQQQFFDFCENKIFAEYSTRSLINKKYKINLVFGTIEECEKQKADFHTIEKWMNAKGTKLTKYLIDRAFNKYESELNLIIN